MHKYVIVSFLFISIIGCTLAKVEVNVVSERTALENQVLGSYNSLTRDVLLVASVRGVDPLGRIESPPLKSVEHQKAMDAVQTLAFHMDDMESFKRLGWVGENTEGLLTGFPMEKENIPSDLKEFADRYEQEEFDHVLSEINASREQIMLRIIETNENFIKEDLPKVRSIFGKLNREKALPWERIQAEDGMWIVKE